MDALKQFMDTANARADANRYKAAAKVMAEYFDTETARLRTDLEHAAEIIQSAYPVSPISGLDKAWADAIIAKLTK